MKWALLVAALVILVLTGGFYTGYLVDIPRERIKMATMWLDDLSEPYIRNMVREMKEAGANTIAVKIHNDGVILFDTDVTNMKVVDVMPIVIDEARKNNLSVYAWTDTLHFPEVMGSHPDWEFITCLKDGEYHYPTPCGWHDRISPFNPGIEEFIREYYQDLASLDIDGIQFQDDVFLAVGEDFSDGAQEEYFNRYGWFNEDSPEDWERMQELKTERITEIVRVAVESAREVNPDLVFVFDVIPEPSEEKMLAYWSIDVEDIADTGVDYIGIMSYHRQLMEEYGSSLEESMDELNMAFESISSQVGKERVIYRIWTSTFDYEHKEIPKSEVEYVLGRMLDAGAFNIGYIPHYPYISNYELFENLD
jgi:uncharacterized lipoprotein YddW (UPF0748 family)